MEKQDLKNLLENIYHLLAEAVPPGESPIYYEPLTVPNPEWDPDNWRSPRYLRDRDDNPLLQSPIFYKPLTPMPPMPGPGGWSSGGGTNGETLSPRPDFPPCPGPGDCLWQWVHTVHWVWNTQGYWELVPNTNQPPGSGDSGGYWKLLGNPLDVPRGHEGIDRYGDPVREPPGGWEQLWRSLTGNNRRPPIGYSWPNDAR